MADADALGDDHTTFIKAEGMPALSRAAFQMHGFAGINSIQDGRPGFVHRLAHDGSIIDPTDPRIIYYIPIDEINTNTLCTQNP